MLSWSHQPVRLAGQVGRALGVSACNRLRVLLYHDIAPEARGRFEAQLRWLQRTWTFVSPERFAAMVTGAEPVVGSCLLLTFDDGFASNRVAAEQVLAPLKIQAIFFVVTAFVEVEDHEAARQFVVDHIEPGRSIDDLPKHVSNMRWVDLEALLEQGHLIGCHTQTHARLSAITAPADLEHETLGSAAILAARLGVPIDHFAYTFGDLASFSEQALATVRRRFRFVYSGLRGDNAGGVSPLALRRDAVRAEEPLALLGAFVEGVADFHYARARAQLDAWADTQPHSAGNAQGAR